MIEGRCYCGAVRYRYDGVLGPIALCHCSQCRQASGAPFAANSPITAAGFRLVSGADAITECVGAGDKKRAFCRHCGSPLYSRRDARPETLRLRMGTVTSPVDPSPSHHIYAASCADWFPITDDLPRYAEMEDSPRL